ncbi:large subunit ribosomal protein L28 [Peptoclostridium litorale DSM 5388]|uniref:Large ribosomal subunit protein bL28 n=1 Tax=Peptoclostridium litorale DSM 5388 TaxID=1121324 RepID=A0A069RAE7_PEPLI|nr:50S ribosomal protein L28 [Peptoclostridium litorale]KDR94039.1 50S ribosomal protein L28 [Peptoclostridium litorale DSM 5388]SIN80003.1 large subunit ribosomal protein L28 [Peptoclostridium litorale DSM 5388]
MAKVCEMCGKGRTSGNQVSHSNRHSKRTWLPNLRSVKALVNGSPKKVKVCTRCLRSGKVDRAI